MRERRSTRMETKTAGGAAALPCAVRAYAPQDLPAMIRIWNQVVEEGAAFPQETPLAADTGAAFFAAQSHAAVAQDADGRVVGLYILHPNNVGRCGHIANASYAVDAACRGARAGEALVRDSLAQGAACGFSILQFNAVVDSNRRARSLYERLGFVPVGRIPAGFRMKDGHYEDIWVYYHTL